MSSPLFLPCCVCVVQEKVDQILTELEAGRLDSTGRLIDIRGQIRDLSAHSSEVHSALASSRGHLASMKRLGKKQQSEQEAQNRKMEEMAALLRNIIKSQSQQAQSNMNSPTQSTTSSNATSPLNSITSSHGSDSSSSSPPPSNYNPFEISADEIILHDELGRGSFGIVYEATYRGQQVAVKKLLLSNDVSAEEGRADFQREVQALCSIRHNRLILAYVSDKYTQARTYEEKKDE